MTNYEAWEKAVADMKSKKAEEKKEDKKSK
jgi:hypothetical protein